MSSYSVLEPVAVPNSIQRSCIGDTWEEDTAMECDLSGVNDLRERLFGFGSR